MGIAVPSPTGSVDSHGSATGGEPGSATGRKDSRGGQVGASDGGITALGGSAHPTMVPGEGTDPCTKSSLPTKNVFDVLQHLSESIGRSPGPQLEAADGPMEPITHDLHQLLIELLERPEILSLHAVRRVGRER